MNRLTIPFKSKSFGLILLTPWGGGASTYTARIASSGSTAEETGEKSERRHHWGVNPILWLPANCIWKRWLGIADKIHIFLLTY